MNRITWFRVFSRHSKRFNRDTAHTTKCSGSVSPHSSPDLPAILQTEQQGGNKKERQEDFNIALRSRTICPFHEPADGRGRNTSPRHKHTPAYFKVTCKWDLQAFITRFDLGEPVATKTDSRMPK
ncbi:hypothetical protein KUCAC02_029056 [Chaenocephalus aceratus]|uniref:Uncharacterized protein n=1 Tax=Chaenocephalus aceratus TaxID=36190 RepID=A0ACB9X5H7_CHAAC|nr:hypothetical protein KUCAC02_029056 [Chaenocephalus aceratus]